jgi:hypothetical protein
MEIIITYYIAPVARIAADIPWGGIVGIQGYMMHIIVFEKMIVSPDEDPLIIGIIYFTM